MKAFAVFAMHVLLAGCASTPNPSRGGFDETPITREQILESGASSLYEVVRKLRPEWLPHFPNTSVIIANDDYEALGRISSDDNFATMSRESLFFRPGGTENVLRLEWIRESEVGSRFISGGYGAIIIRYRPGGGG
jgi:hypothetical protein